MSFPIFICLNFLQFNAGTITLWPKETLILLIHVYKTVHLIHTQIAVGESSCDCTFRPVCGELHAYHILIILSIPVSV